MGELDADHDGLYDDEPAPVKSVRWIVCPVCEGKGTHVNPDIDANGLTAEDFDEDPDFAEDYRSGVYDVTCYTCKGRTTVPDDVPEKLAQAAEDRRLAAREDGDWEAYQGAQDHRWGY